MDNLKLPAYPGPIPTKNEGQIHAIGNYEYRAHGFTKLELAALMIAQGIYSNSNVEAMNTHFQTIAETSVTQAKAILEEANK